MVANTPIATAYLENLAARLARLHSDNAEMLARAANAVERAANADGRVFIFGTGHSHTLAEEAHYRAGGLALTVPILCSTTMVHEGAVAGTVFERMPGLVAPIFDRYPMDSKDVLIVVSNSGVNAATVEAAQIGKERGVTVIAITSISYSIEAANGRIRLAQVADIVLDNGVPPGDAIMELPESLQRAGPVSTSIGAALMNAVFVEVASRLQSSGSAPVYRSANMPGAKDINEALVKRYRPRNPHL